MSSESSLLPDHSHCYRYLRTESRDILGPHGMLRGTIVEDIFYCQLCLEYRSVEIPRVPAMSGSRTVREPFR